jgi:hypothetical protein
MHAFTKLKLQLAEAQAKAAALETGLRDLRAHLDSDKFRGQDIEGHRNDWIATGDLDNRILAILRDGQTAADEAGIEPAAA